MREYNIKKIEKKWQRYWEKNGLFRTPKDATAENKMYILPQLPYPSASGLHVGHAEVYTACDIYARYQRMRGRKVLQVIGWDSFGLPAENYAIKTNVHPRKSTNLAIDNFREQIKSLGISVDWEREVGAHNPDYYKWTQWFFLLFYKRGLAYRKKQMVNWCPGCQTVLANEQVADGHCERCDTQVEQREMEQWFLKITDYADRLLAGLDKIDWPEETKKRQRDWIGRSEGAEIEFRIKNEELRIKVFTTRPDTLFGATYLVLAPEHELVKSLKLKTQNEKEIDEYVGATKKKTELERQTQQTKTGVELKGVKAINPASGEEIPVWTADYVLATYGTGAIMAVPAHDERDWEFVKMQNAECRMQNDKLKIKNVIRPYPVSAKVAAIRPVGEPLYITKKINELEKKILEGKEVYTGDGILVNSDFLNGLETDAAKEKMILYLQEKGLGKRKVQYKLRDWSVSRQRFWGAPIPMLYDEKGELHPVPEADLPVILPDDVDFKPTGESPLSYSKKFQTGVEKKYGRGWRREADTLDTFMCSSWYYYRYLDPDNREAFASPVALKKWMPVDFYLGGEEHVNGHLLYSRFFTKVLFDAGFISFDEPFLVHRHQGLILGEDNRKMSKRWGNQTNPTDVVAKYGADTLRLYEMFMGPLAQTKPWSTDGVKGMSRFLERVWKVVSEDRIIEDKDRKIPKFAIRLSTNQEEIQKEAIGREIKIVDKALNILVKNVSEDMKEMKFNTTISELMIFINEVYKFDVNKKQFEIFLKLLSPLAPHLAEELWQNLGNKKSITLESWPEFDPSKVKDETITLAVQVNGKLRATIEAPAGVTQAEAEKLARGEENVKKYIEGKEIKKVIFIKGKLISFVV